MPVMPSLSSSLETVKPWVLVSTMNVQIPLWPRAFIGRGENNGVVRFFAVGDPILGSVDFVATVNMGRGDFKARRDPIRGRAPKEQNSPSFSPRARGVRKFVFVPRCRIREEERRQESYSRT